MPQLDFATYAAQIFWMAICFAILYFLMSRVSLPKVRDVLQHRNDRIASDLKKAESFKKEAEAAEADFTLALFDAKKTASDLVSKAKEKAKLEETKRYAKIEENFAKQMKSSEQRIQTVEKESKEKLQPVIFETTKLMAERLIGVKLKDSEIEKALNS